MNFSYSIGMSVQKINDELQGLKQETHCKDEHGWKGLQTIRKQGLRASVHVAKNVLLQW